MLTPTPSTLLALLASLATSITLCLGFVRTFTWHARFTSDEMGHGPQNRHGIAVPRVGGAAVGVAGLRGMLLLPASAGALGLAVLFVGLPALVCGLAEDTTRRVGPLYRLAATAVGGALAWDVLGAHVAPLGLPSIDLLLGVAALNLLLTLIVIAGVANATNIIDGVNGLASGCLAIMATVIALAAWQVGDATLAAVATVLAGSIAGFMVCNYPGGRIFLGDGGAYFGGTAVTVLALLLVHRNAAISPVFPFALTAFPVIETLYSSWRRAARRGRSPFKADRLHLHSLIQSRLLRCTDILDAPSRNLERNARTAPYLWAVTLCGALPCALVWSSSAGLWAAIAVTLVVYAGLYRTVVHGRAPAWLRQESSHAASARGAPSMLN